MTITPDNRPAWNDLLPVLFTGQLTPATKIVWVYLVSTGGVVANNNSALYEGIARNVNMAGQTVRKALQQLADTGLAEWSAGEARALAVLPDDLRGWQPDRQYGGSK